MQTENKRKRNASGAAGPARKKAAWQPPAGGYKNPPIPYAISRPNAFWRIKKNGVDPAIYWRKRYYRRRITGKGAYRMNSNDSFGRRWGGYLGSRLGEWAGGGISKILGFGDYTVRKNIFSGQLPEVINQPGGGGTVIRFQEYLQDIFTAPNAGDFNISTFLLNAANPRTFPFLSQIAANYDQYEFEGVLFQFKSTSADALNSVNTALGSVMMATQYDVSDPIFASKTEMLNYEFSTSCKPSCSNMHMIECDPHQTAQQLYYTLNTAATPPGTDPRLYHLGNFSIATTGFQGTNVNVGELHVTYQVRLLKPKLFDALGNAIPDYVAQTALTTGTFTNASPLGVAALSVPAGAQNTLAIVINQNIPNQIIWPATSAVLYYRVELIWIGGATSGALVVPTITATNGSIVQQTYPNNGVSASTAGTALLGVRTAGNATSLTLTFTGSPNLPQTGNIQFLIRVLAVNPLGLGL